MAFFNVGLLIVRAPSLALVIGAWTITAATADDFQCAAPLMQTESEVRVEVTGRAQGLLNTDVAELKSKADKTVVDLFSKYPNSDRVAVTQNLLSTACNIIKNSRQMSDADKFEKWMSVMPAIRAYLPENNKSEYKDPALDLELLDLGVGKDFTEERVGKPKFMRIVEIEAASQKGARAKKEKLKEYHYRHSGLDIRIIYDGDGQATSIFVGLDVDENTVSIAGAGSWPVQSQIFPVRWSALKFGNVGDDTCEQRVATAASASIVSITCDYLYYPPGGSSYSKQHCYFSAGYSDGAFSVKVLDNGPELTEMDVDEFRSKVKKASEIKAYVWDKIKGAGLNYFMITCDKRLLKSNW